MRDEDEVDRAIRRQMAAAGANGVSAAGPRPVGQVWAIGGHCTTCGCPLWFLPGEVAMSRPPKVYLQCACALLRQKKAQRELARLEREEKDQRHEDAQ